MPAVVVLARKPVTSRPLSVTEVMRRGERLARLRAAGVRDPHRFIRSNHEMQRALLIQAAVTGRPATYLIPSEKCVWCGVKIPGGEIACDEHRELEDDLREEFGRGWSG